MWRHTGQSPFTVGAAGTPRVLVCIAGEGELEHSGTNYPVGRGDVVLLPAEVGACSYRPRNASQLAGSRTAGIVPVGQDRDGEQSQEQGNSKNEKARCFRPGRNTGPEQVID